MIDADKQAIFLDRIRFDRDHALLGELEGDRAAGGEVASGALEDVADVGGGARAVVGRGFDQDGDPARRVAFVGGGFVVFAAQLAGAFLDGIGDRVLGHVGGLGLVDGVAEVEVVAGVAPVPGGDDDLFINQVANKHNTRVVLDPDSITLSQPKKKFSHWLIQKNRHYTTAKYYKASHKFLLALYSVSFFLFYPLFVASLIFYDWRIALGVFALRFLSQAYIYNKAMQKLNEKDLFVWWWAFDLWMFFYYCIFAPALWKRAPKTWN